MPRSLWTQVNAIPPLVASVIAIVSALIAAASWVTGYFATQSQLRYVHCLSKANVELISHQIESANLYSRYVNIKVKFSGGKETAELKAESDRIWEKLKRVDEKADELAKSLKGGLCGLEGKV